MGSPIIGTCPCKNANDIAVWLEAGVPLRDNNRYYLFINKFFPADSVIKLSFDSEVNISFSVISDNEKFSRVSVTDGDIFTIRLFAQQQGLGLSVRGLTPGVTPNLIGLTINDVEHCTEPDLNVLQKYTENENTPKDGEYRLHVESRRSKKAERLRNCGRRDVGSELTVDGEAEPGAWPWFAAIYHSERSLRYICGGTLISTDSVLTAGHCVTNREPKNLIVLVGRYALEDWAELFIGRKVDRVITPENDGANTSAWLSADLAMLKFQPVPLTDGVQPACLWDRPARGLADTANGTIVGWGYDENDDLLENLHQANMKMVPRAAANNYFCAGFHQNGTYYLPNMKDSDTDTLHFMGVFIPDSMPEGCQRESKPSGSWHVRGVLSQYTGSDDAPAATCAQSHVVFTDVDKSRDWILANLDD
nr:chymotrypsin-like elastase family member 2A [Maniola hyperantus]